MSLETAAGKIIGGAMIDAAGGSVVVLGAIILIGIAILMKKVNMGVSSGIMITVLILGIFVDQFNSHNVGPVLLGGNFPFFNYLFIFLVLGAAIYWTFFLKKG